MKNLKKISAILGIIMFFIFSAQPAALAYNFATQSGLNTTATGAGYTADSAKTPEYYIGQAIQMVLSFLGILFLGFVIYAGVYWMTAGGNEEKAKKAKEMLIETSTGLIIVLIAYASFIFIYNYFSTVK